MKNRAQSRDPEGSVRERLALTLSKACDVERRHDLSRLDEKTQSCEFAKRRSGKEAALALVHSTHMQDVERSRAESHLDG